MDRAPILAVLLNYRTPEMTVEACASAIEEMRALGGEIVIVDNGSGDGSFDLLCEEVQARGWAESGLVRVLQSGRNGGFGAGMNFGMAAGLSDGTRPGFFYLLNSDAKPDPGAIRALRDFLLSKPKAGLVGSALRGPDGEPHRTAFRFPSIAGEFEANARIGVISRLFEDSIVAFPVPRDTIRVDWTAGASLMIRAEVIDATGGFDETFFLYYEETDLCRRALQAGWSTYYLPASRVVHIGSASTGMKTWSRTPGYFFDSRLYYLAKHHGRGYAAMATIAALGGGVLWRLRRLVGNKPQVDPDRHWRDMARHSLGALFRPRRSAARSELTPLTEDRR
ncbi:glycosyltransferase family 2 protein [Lutimaribacter marinistellae]|uniref:Glycosyltransferase family 2 protein n=1 Tax=Lutimaribacter marinistellae TaxID=1820329 RepID=A0ABV7THC6_9RHOB